MSMGGVFCSDEAGKKKSPNIEPGDNYQVHLPLPYSASEEQIPVIFIQLCLIAEA